MPTTSIIIKLNNQLIEAQKDFRKGLSTTSQGDLKFQLMELQSAICRFANERPTPYTVEYKIPVKGVYSEQNKRLVRVFYSMKEAIEFGIELDDQKIESIIEEHLTRDLFDVTNLIVVFNRARLHISPDLPRDQKEQIEELIHG